MHTLNGRNKKKKIHPSSFQYDKEEWPPGDHMCLSGEAWDGISAYHDFYEMKPTLQAALWIPIVE